MCYPVISPYNLLVPYLDGEGRIATDGSGKAVKGKQRDVSPPSPSMPAREESAVAILSQNHGLTQRQSSSMYSTSISSQANLADESFSHMNIQQPWKNHI
jgi:hypothetical protein